MSRLLDALHLFALGEIFRVALSLLVVGAVPFVVGILRRKILSRENTCSNERLARVAMWRNGIIFGAVLAILAIWGTKIAGFAFSVAALAGAVLLVSKEALLNLIGFLHISMGKPYGFGDYVEIGSSRGRVVDITATNTRLMETCAGHQVTGSIVSVPNFMTLTQPVRNFTATGEFVVFLVTVAIDREDDVLRHEHALLAAAENVCRPWHDQATAHLAHSEITSAVDLPSADSRVIIELGHDRARLLTLRYACRPHYRVKTEQEILRQYLGLVRQANATEAISAAARASAVA